MWAAGLSEFLNSLSQRVGAAGEVVGLEYVPRFAKMASAEIGRLGLSNVKVIQADALTSGLDRNSFDFAHERLVMINRPNPKRFSPQWSRWFATPGIVAAEEVDDASWLCSPRTPSWDILVGIYHSAFGRHGGNVFFGRRLPEMLRSRWPRRRAVQSACGHRSSRTDPDGSTFFHFWTCKLHDKVISLGLLAEDELAMHKATHELHLDDPNTLVIDKLLVQSWGRKPSSRTAILTEAWRHILCVASERPLRVGHLPSTTGLERASSHCRHALQTGRTHSAMHSTVLDPSVRLGSQTAVALSFGKTSEPVIKRCHQQ